LLALAGLADHWQGEGGEVVDSCTVLTTAASPDVESVHPRMPVLLEPEAFDLWLRPTPVLDVLERLLVPAPAGFLEKEAVARTVNDPRQDDPRCLDPEPPADQGTLFELGR
jgi:putative SOS response-associated peptidase YedK